VLVAVVPLLPGPVAVVVLLAALLVVVLPPGREQKFWEQTKNHKGRCFYLLKVFVKSVMIKEK
jgi:hypothetical protein